jgi:hypothetical protein
MSVNLPWGERVSDLPQERILEVEGPELGKEPQPVKRRGMTDKRPRIDEWEDFAVVFMGERKGI